MNKIKAWFFKKALAAAAREVASGIKDANLPLLNAMIDAMDNNTIIDLVALFARESDWQYRNGTVFEHLLSLGEHMGEYAQVWKEFLTTLQNQFDEKENEK